VRCCGTSISVRVQACCTACAGLAMNTGLNTICACREMLSARRGTGQMNRPASWPGVRDEQHLAASHRCVRPHSRCGRRWFLPDRFRDNRQRCARQLPGRVLRGGYGLRVLRRGPARMVWSLGLLAQFKVYRRQGRPRTFKARGPQRPGSSAGGGDSLGGL